MSLQSKRPQKNCDFFLSPDRRLLDFDKRNEQTQIYCTPSQAIQCSHFPTFPRMFCVEKLTIFMRARMYCSMSLRPW